MLRNLETLAVSSSSSRTLPSLPAVLPSSSSLSIWKTTGLEITRCPPALSSLKGTHLVSASYSLKGTVQWEDGREHGTEQIKKAIKELVSELEPWEVGQAGAGPWLGWGDGGREGLKLIDPKAACPLGL